MCSVKAYLVCETCEHVGLGHIVVCGPKTKRDCMRKHVAGEPVVHASWSVSSPGRRAIEQGARKRKQANSPAVAGGLFDDLAWRRRSSSSTRPRCARRRRASLRCRSEPSRLQWRHRRQGMRSTLPRQSRRAVLSAQRRVRRLLAVRRQHNVKCMQVYTLTYTLVYTYVSQPKSNLSVLHLRCRPCFALSHVCSASLKSPMPAVASLTAAPEV